MISDTPTVAKIKTTETITGGAGRFAGARGTSTTTGETSVMPNGDQVFSSSSAVRWSRTRDHENVASDSGGPP